MHIDLPQLWVDRSWGVSWLDSGIILRRIPTAVGLDRAAIWPSCHYDALARTARSVTSAHARAADALNSPTVARTSVDRSAGDVMCGGCVCGSRTQFAVGTRGVRPINRGHERVDIGGRSCSVIHVIRVLVHIECQDRASAGERRRVVHRPLIDKLAIARRPGEQHPTRTAALRFAHSREFGSPAIEGPEIADERVAHLALWRALVPKRGDDQL